MQFFAAVIARVIANKAKTKVDSSEVESALNEQVEALRDDAFASMVDAFRSLSPDKSTKTATLAAKPAFESRWKEANGRSVVSGKEALAGIFTWAQAKHKVSLSTAALIHEMRTHEIHKDIKNVIRSVTSRR